jgi:DHA1 family bicyclomycin/chloramphenicol resistance-like MFS transporter
MNPDASTLWRAPRWALALLLAMLGMLGPFAVDTYLPAFEGISASVSASPVQMQQTLSAYLFGFAFMNLFHGALADSFGRRPVILGGVAVFALASAGCALSESIGALVFFRTLQGLSTGAGIVVSRAVIRDMFAPADAQRVMSQVTIFFGVAPAIAPIIGGWLFVHLGWHSIFWFLAAVGVFLVIANWRLLPESLHVSQRQPFNVPHLMRGYWQVGANPRFLALALASGIPFNGMFLYVLSTPTFLGHHLALGPTEFWWFFALNIGSIMVASWWSGRLAGRIRPHVQVRWGFTIMLVASAINVLANLMWTAHVSWAMLPIALFSFGWALNVPVVTLMVLDLNPARRGMASSLQAVVGSTANGFVAGVVSPLVMHSTVALAVAAFAMLGIGLASWSWVRTRVPGGAT